MTIRSQEAKESLIAYINAHPEERLWQAIRNWSEADSIIYVTRTLEQFDTFYLEGK